VKTDNALGQAGLEVAFELVRGAVAEHGVPPVKIEVGVKVVTTLLLALQTRAGLVEKHRHSSL
jgi:hypothetical protein